jgi:hypothetical protein
VRGSLDVNNDAPVIANSDVATRAVTIDTGGPVVNGDRMRLSSTPGTPGPASMITGDPSLSDPSFDSNRMFVSVFGMDRDTYRAQPAAVRVTCGGDCGPAIATAVVNNPGRVIWLDGDVTIGSNTVLGSPPDEPVMIVMRGNLTVSANLQLHGVIYLQEAVGVTTWTTNAGNTTIHGAVVAESDLAMHGAPTIVFNPGVLRTINLTQGSLVRIPGSWRDFAPGS